MKIMGSDKIATILVNKGLSFNQSTIRNRIKGGYSDCFDQYFTFRFWCTIRSNTIKNVSKN
jgi:hypothetical protein